MSIPKGRKRPNISKISVCVVVSLTKMSACAFDTEEKLINPICVSLSDFWHQIKIDRWRTSDLIQTSNFGGIMFCQKWLGKFSRGNYMDITCALFAQRSLMNSFKIVIASTAVVVQKTNIYIHKYFGEHCSSSKNANEDNYAHM